MAQATKMSATLLGGLLLGSALLPLRAPLQAQAQTQPGKTTEIELSGEDNAAWRARPFVIVQSSNRDDRHESYYGSWDEAGSRLRDYAKAHPGNYLLYAQAGSLYRVESPALLAEADKFSVPMSVLADQQRDLSSQQRPLSEQQRALSETMRATHDPRLMGRIGQQQGLIGRQQGALGREQGVIGRQQGLLGRALYQGVQQKLDSCLADKTCAANAVS